MFLVDDAITSALTVQLDPTVATPTLLCEIPSVNCVNDLFFELFIETPVNLSLSSIKTSLPFLAYLQGMYLLGKQ
ncbi:hypothetical protein J3U57_06575 [Gilliamella sp. B3464]|uniref:hypothetical protein n=1 Tax=unclassified Gilliamella TaxID=2685620 RepID=UPI002269B8E9|nr:MULTISPECIES: hypothetical protein [unclassified Gilliamella]MCX8712223.1 hypothetical protein [Gilliamella sp. B3468]MCX8727212.1 hypothetical protein [Gilliamella sp. B2838]MCX8751231.1 hypothetical protein [Gilliamella sp. B3464]